MDRKNVTLGPTWFLMGNDVGNLACLGQPKDTNLHQSQNRLDNQHFVLTIHKLHAERLYGISLVPEADINWLAARLIARLQEAVEVALVLEVCWPAAILTILRFL